MYLAWVCGWNGGSAGQKETKKERKTTDGNHFKHCPRIWEEFLTKRMRWGRAFHEIGVELWRLDTHLMSIIQGSRVKNNRKERVAQGWERKNSLVSGKEIDIIRKEFQMEKRRGTNSPQGGLMPKEWQEYRLVSPLLDPYGDRNTWVGWVSKCSFGELSGDSMWGKWKAEESKVGTIENIHYFRQEVIFWTRLMLEEMGRKSPGWDAGSGVESKRTRKRAWEQHTSLDCLQWTRKSAPQITSKHQGMLLATYLSWASDFTFCSCITCLI